MALPVTARAFGSLPGGKPVEAWTLCGRGGLVVEAITYGATVTSLLAPDRNGRLADVVLGFDNLESYLAGRFYFGAFVGRVAGRITGAHFYLEGVTYELAGNDGPNHLHGGIEGFDKKIWAAIPQENADGAPSLCLTYRSPDGEEGYPGEVDVAVTYTVTDYNALLVEVEASTDRPTPFCPTQHSYFNLAGEAAGSIADHELQIDSDAFVLTDERMTLLGQVATMIGRDNDFRQLRNVGKAIPRLFRNHGDLYRIGNGGEGIPNSKPAPAARLVHPDSGRVLEVFTTETHLQLYTGVDLDGALAGKSGVPYGPYAGICLECEGYPDGVNDPSLGDIILRPGHPQRRTTAYAFSTQP
jgi:aldose 1-epimerase